MQTAIKLPFQFDGDRMKQELESISDSFQLIKNNYTGNTLEGMHLILPNKDALKDEEGKTYFMSEELKRCPYLQEVLNTFQSNILTYRTQNLKPGGKIGLHRDRDKGLDSNIVRLNITVSTNEEILTFYNGERIPMENGECWLPDVTKEHYMENNSNQTRWLLMMDCDLNDWWKGILKDYGVDFENQSKYIYKSVEELKNIRLGLLSVGFDENHEYVIEVDDEIAKRF